MGSVRHLGQRCGTVAHFHCFVAHHRGAIPQPSEHRPQPHTGVSERGLPQEGMMRDATKMMGAATTLFVLVLGFSALRLLDGAARADASQSLEDRVAALEVAVTGLQTENAALRADLTSAIDSIWANGHFWLILILFVVTFGVAYRLFIATRPKRRESRNQASVLSQ